MTTIRTHKEVIAQNGLPTFAPDFTEKLKAEHATAIASGAKLRPLKKSDFYEAEWYDTYMDKVGNLLTAITNGKKLTAHIKAVQIALGIDPEVYGTIKVDGFGLKLAVNRIADTAEGEALREARKALAEAREKLVEATEPWEVNRLSDEVTRLKEEVKAIEEAGNAFDGKPIKSVTVKQLAYFCEVALAEMLSNGNFRETYSKYNNGDWLKYRVRATELTTKGYTIDGDSFVKADDLKGLKEAVKKAYTQKKADEAEAKKKAEEEAKQTA